MILDTELKRQVEEVIKYSQGYKGDFNSLPMLEKWYLAKKYFIDQWNGELIYEVPELVSFDLSENEKMARLDEFINTVSMVYENDDLADFLYDIREDFFHNRLSQDYPLVNLTLNKGTKIIKSFKYFAEGKALEDLQNMASMLIQEDKVVGKLCFSVHPLDFLSSSENNHKWRSCHALDGEYRSGNLSYMMDTTTVICYLRSDADDTKLPHFPPSVPWNDKKWRMLLFLSENKDFVMAGRQYPFFNHKALDLILQNMAQFTPYSFYPKWSNWYNDYITSSPGKREQLYDRDLLGKYINMNQHMYCLNEIIVDVGNLHYNDLLHSTCYTPYYAWYRDTIQQHYPRFQIGSNVLCPCCGKELIKYSDLLVCVECATYLGEGEDELFSYCPHCDSRVFRDDMQYIPGFECCICPNCVANETQACESCGTAWPRCDLVFVEKTQRCECPSCRRPPISNVQPIMWFEDFELPF